MEGEAAMVSDVLRSFRNRTGNAARILVLLIVAGALVGCNLMVPEKVSYDDKRLKPMFDAMAAVDRASLGFTPVPKNAELKLEGPSKYYDAMLLVSFNNRESSIAFRKQGNGYRWIGEQEIHSGPSKSYAYEKVKYETITITYETEYVTGMPPNKVHIKYDGPMGLIMTRGQLSLQEAIKIEKQWDAMYR
jgi:hypothetical protein